MDDAWFQKLLLPSLNDIPPPVFSSILNHWYESRTVTNREWLTYIFLTQNEIELLNFLKSFAIHSVLAGDAAAVTVKQKPYRGSQNVYIPVYGNLERHFKPTLQNMIAKSKQDSAQNDPSEGIKELLRYSRKNVKSDCKTKICQAKRSGNRFIKFQLGITNVIWIEIPLDRNSFFAQRVPLQALFIFYLLGGTFDIPSSRVAILSWENEPTVKGLHYFPLYPTEILHLTYRFPGYEKYVLMGECDYYNIAHLKPKECLKKTRPHYYKRKNAAFQNAVYRIHNLANYLDKFTIYDRFRKTAEVVKYPNYQVVSLTCLCLNILVSLSDLQWVKFKQNFPYTRYGRLSHYKSKIREEYSLRL